MICSRESRFPYPVRSRAAASLHGAHKVVNRKRKAFAGNSWQGAAPSLFIGKKSPRRFFQTALYCRLPRAKPEGCSVGDFALTWPEGRARFHAG